MSGFTSVSIAPDCGGVLIASPDLGMRQAVLRRLHEPCRPVLQVAGGADALSKLENGEWQALFLDRRLPDLDPEEVIAISHHRFPGVQVIILDSEEETTGANPRETLDERRSGNGLPPAATAHQLAAVEPLPGMIGSSEAMQSVYRMVRLVAPRTTTVLIEGPTGTGKELVARALHALSPRAAKPFIVVNCAAIPETLLESELFGYARGAFTGAVQSQVGRVAAAHGGTLFLDEVSELPLRMQAKLLRFLEQKEVQRLGTCETTRVDVRILAASNADLAKRAARGRFRRDLFYRLSTFPITLPPLAQRRGDIVPLAEHFLACMAAAMQARIPRFSAEAIGILENHPWLGNVRELQHVIERASILVEAGDTIAAQHLYFPESDPTGTPEPSLEQS
jgi:DNA-binding NtrC family response regulator